MKDVEERLRGCLDKETFYKNQIDDLNMKYNKLNEELRIQKATSGHSFVNDHEIAE